MPKKVDNDLLLRLSKDLKKASKLLNRVEARFLVDMYYGIQKVRTGTGERIKSSGVEPIGVLTWVYNNMDVLETDIKVALDIFAKEYKIGRWLQGICGIGPVLSAAFLAELDIRERMLGPCTCKDAHQDKVHGKGIRAHRAVRGLPDRKGNITFECTGYVNKKMCRQVKEIKATERKSKKGMVLTSTAGSWWKFAGLDPTTKWKKKTKRPWNARLKVLVWKTTGSFVRTQYNENDFYGKLYIERKKLEIRKNEAGLCKDAAAEGAERVGKGTDAYKFYIKGVLPPGHVDAKARRYVGKLFLSHLHEKCYEDYYGSAPPVPYAFTKHCEGDHKHYIAPPDIEVKGGKPLKALLDR